MVKITQEMEDVMNGVKIFYLATASKDGVPNVAPMGMVYLQEDKETIW
ncbi:MAG: pyridoxamine 5'-phosphate oxidase family protein, partial [Candidatus Methanomethylophilaceae archaeon]|nr:pyridoxamine 5'-phosphate oxidase family protein [Candidatus Methanomethylophilaceae archaeon]